MLCAPSSAPTKFSSRLPWTFLARLESSLESKLWVLVFVQEGFSTMQTPWGGCHIPFPVPNAPGVLILAVREGLLSQGAPAMAKASPAAAARGFAAVQRPACNSV